jgi:hypothetical protein
MVSVGLRLRWWVKVSVARVKLLEEDEVVGQGVEGKE